MEAADIMVDWIHQSDTQHMSAQREIAEFRSEVRADIAELRHEMHTGYTELGSKIDTNYAALSSKIDVGYASLEASFTKSHADFMKWTLGFWVLSLAAVVGAVVGPSRGGR